MHHAGRVAWHAPDLIRKSASDPQHMRGATHARTVSLKVPTGCGWSAVSAYTATTLDQTYTNTHLFSTNSGVSSLIINGGVVHADDDSEPHTAKLFGRGEYHLRRFNLLGQVEKASGRDTAFEIGMQQLTVTNK